MLQQLINCQTLLHIFLEAAKDEIVESRRPFIHVNWLNLLIEDGREERILISSVLTEGRLSCC